MEVCIIHRAIQTNMPLLDFNCQIWLACVWFEHTLISHRSHIYALFPSSPFLRMVSSEHHRPRGMCFCLAIINMSYSWADSENKVRISFFFFFFLTNFWSEGQKDSSLFHGLPILSDPLLLKKILLILGLKCQRDTGSCVKQIFCLKCLGFFKYILVFFSFHWD